MATAERDSAFWALQGQGWMLLIYLIFTQGIAAFCYGLGVAMGTQKPVLIALWGAWALLSLVRETGRGLR